MNICQFVITAFLLLSGLVDGVRRAQFGSLSGLGVLTTLAGTTTYLLIMLRREVPKKAVSSILFNGLFVLMCCLSFIVNLPTSEVSVNSSLQNLFSYTAFYGLLCLSLMETYRAQSVPWYISDGFMMSALIGCILYGISYFMGADGFVAARPFATFTAVMIPYGLAAWRYGQIQGSWLAIALTVLVAASLSRTATVVSVIMYPISRFTPNQFKGWVQLGVWLALIGLTAYLCFNYVEPIRDRFTDTGDNAELGGFKVNTSGRERIWTAVELSIQKSPWIGQGPATVELVASKVSVTPHPHNDYLRIIHDFGYIGCGLWLTGIVGLLVQTTKNWLWADRYDRHFAHIHLAALLGLISVSLVMLTDNILVYLFAMAPLGILVGSSLGLGLLRRKQNAEYQRLMALQEQMSGVSSST